MHRKISIILYFKTKVIPASLPPCGAGGGAGASGGGEDDLAGGLRVPALPGPGAGGGC